jgi:hypothetical protein
MLPSEIDYRFDHHPPANQAVIFDHEAVRNTIKLTAVALNNILPEGREKSIVFTHLEDALMWANAAIARHNSE